MRRHLLAFAFGVLGVGFALVAVHAYQDHVALHQVIGYLNAQAAKPAAEKEAPQ